MTSPQSRVPASRQGTHQTPADVREGEGAGVGRAPRTCAREGCGHLRVVHDLRRRTAGWVRTACSVIHGPDGRECGCPLYLEVSR